MSLPAPWPSSPPQHGPLVLIAPGVWMVSAEGPPLSRKMVVHRLESGGLLLHSVVALREEEMASLESLGTPEILLVPNGFHRMDAPAYKARYPGLRVLCPAAARKKVEEVVPVDATCEEALPSLGIRLHTPEGVRPSEIAYDLPTSEGRVLVVADLLFNIPEAPQGFSGFILKYITASIGPLGISRVFRLLLLQNARTYARWLYQLSTLPDLRALLVAHGDPVTENISAAIREASLRIDPRAGESAG